jgi:hypothetical protein
LQFFLSFCTVVTLLSAQEKQFVPSVDKPESVSLLELPRKLSNPSSSSPTKSPRHRKPLQYTPINKAYRDTSVPEKLEEANGSSHTRATGGLSSDEDRGRGNVIGTSKSKNGLKAVVGDLRAGLRELPTSMRSVMMVMALTWVRISQLSCPYSASYSALIPAPDHATKAGYRIVFESSSFHTFDHLALYLEFGRL